jgi:hypothetical protein
VWERTEPIEMKFVCRLEMESSGLRDVVEPTKKLLLYTLPSEDSIGGLVAPGPSVVNAIRNIAQNLEGDAGYVEKINNFVNPLLENILSDGDGNLTLVVGDYLSLSPVIITQVIPTFSNSVDDEGYPIWVNLDISIRTANVPTKSIGVGNGITMSAGGN